MRDLIIHAGPAKTGSSTIQRFLFANASVLAAAGFYIPRQSNGGIKGNHAQLMTAPGGSAPAPPPAAHELAGELADRDFPQTVILSYEGYGGVLGKPEFREMLAAFAGSLGYRVSVVSFVRPQLALINSQYNELSKTLRPSPPIEEILHAWVSLTLANNYQRRLANFTRGGLLDITFVPFNTATLRDGLCKTFLRRTGVPEAVIAACEPVAHSNLSLGPKALAAMRAIAASVADKTRETSPARLNDLATLLHSLLTEKGWNTGRFDGLDPAAKERLRNAYAQSNEAFARAAWNAHWQDIFGADEAEAMAQPRSVFDPAAADPAERAEFEAFCRDGAALVREALARG